MTEVAFARRPPEALLRLELWGDLAVAQGRDLLPDTLGAIDTAMGRLVWIEPGVFLLRAPLGSLDASIAHLERIAGEDGAVIDITGGLACFIITGSSWRELLTIGGVFDVENPAFAPGCTAATVLHHAAIWIDVLKPDAADVYCLPSYAEELAEGWTRAIRRMKAEMGLAKA